MDKFFNDASIVMTVVSLITFLGILAWAYWVKGSRDFEEAAHLPFDEQEVSNQNMKGDHHG
jgi:cytochrome c oxidase cbb3-type subunit 4